MSVVTKEIRQAIQEEVTPLFLEYVQISSTSSPGSTSVPSTEEQWDMLNKVASQIEELGITPYVDRKNAFVYATLPANAAGHDFGLLAHVDTSPDQSGTGVVPVLHENYQGGELRFPKDPALVLSPSDSPNLLKEIGNTIITASGDTLLGADDKAGVAAIIAALSIWQKYPELPHPNVHIAITRDEEVGTGVDGIDKSRLPRFCYTIDGSAPGELEYECFDAIGVKAVFKGIGVHPGYAKDKMVNAVLAAAHFGALLNRDEMPETTEGRQGFVHISNISGNNEKATMSLILRDFEPEHNQRRLQALEQFKSLIVNAFPGLEVEFEVKQQYPNMREFIEEDPRVVEKARDAIKASGLEVIEKPIRGGTDGSKLSAMGILTPNIFAGGELFHSRKEWTSVERLVQVTSTILNLGKEWTK